MLEFLFDTDPVRRYAAHREYADAASPQRTPNSNFLRGVRWSPDGACLLTASDDNCLRIYDTPLEAFEPAGQQEPQPAGQRVPAQPPSGAAQRQAMGEGDSLAPALRIQEGEQLYDWCWYSRMCAAEPASCCLATTGRAQPVHLWDALTGELRCTYRAFNEMDEVAPAHSLAFALDGATLYCGFGRGTLRAFRVERPGRDCQLVAAYKKGGDGLGGILSCMAPNPDHSGMLAVGSYSGAAALLDPRTREVLCLLEGGHAGGITHLCFSADGNYLYTGARKDAALLCWDVRYASGVLYSMQRCSGGTNQRMWFDVEPCGRHLATGGEDGAVRVFDLRDGSLAAQFAAAEDTVNGVHFHPILPLLATSSGQRRYFLAPSDSDASSSSESDNSDADTSGSGSESEGSQRRHSGRGALSPRENLLAVWRCAARPVQVEAADQGQGEEEAGVAAAADGDGDEHMADGEAAAADALAE